MVAQEMAAQAMDDDTRQAFEEEKRKSANAGESSFVYLGGQIPIDASTLPNADLPTDPNMPDLEDVSNVFPNDGIFNGAYDDDEVGAEADFNNMNNTIDVSPIPTLKIHKVHPKDQILGDPKLAVQTRGKIQKASSVQQALFKLQKVWVLVELPYGKKVIGTKWVFRNKRDERSIIVKNKARLVAQGFRQEEGIDYDEVFAPVARIEAIRLFLAFASYMGFTVYQMDVKSAFLYVTIRDEVYVQQPLGFVDPAHPNKVYKVLKSLYGLHQAPKAWYETLSSFLLENSFRRGTIDKTLFIKKNKSDIITATTPIESNKPMVKDEDGVDIDVHVYRSMIGSLMYLTASRPNIMFDVCACARFQVYPKASHLNAVKRIFRYLKHQPKLGLWYPRDSPFKLEAFSDSDYGGASLDRKSTTGGCQFLGRRLISWQCKKQTTMANSTTEAEYVAAASCCGQVLWIQNQMMDYGFNFMKTKIHIDNESTICIVKNPVYHSRTKHIEIRHHFIRDCYEKRLIVVIKIHTDNNVADLLTKGFDVTRFNFLVLELILLRKSMDLRMDGSCDSNFSHIWVMTTLRYSDKHNMVAFLKKPNESVGFTEIVDFLKGTYLRYALTHNPTIYDSLVKQFWQTATVRTLANGTQKFVASIDNKEYTITEASVRSKFQLTDATGEHVPLLPAMLAVTSTSQPLQQPSPPRQLDRQYTEIPQSQDLTFTNVADEATTTGVRVGTEGAATTISVLDAGLDSGNIHESPLRSHEAPLHKGHTLGSAEDRLKLKDLMDIIPKLVARIADLEKELHQTKHTYGKEILTLVDRAKSLEKTLRRKTKKVVISDSKDEEPEDQGRKIQDLNDDPLVCLVRESMKEKDTDFVTPTKVSASGEAQESEISPTILEATKTLSQVASQTISTYKRIIRLTNKGKGISTGLDAEAKVNTSSEDFNNGSLGVSTGSGPVSTPSVVQTINVIIPSPIKSQREGKAPMTTEEIQATKRIKAQIQQEKASLAEAMRLKALQEEEAARQVHLDALLAKRISKEEELSEQQKKRKAEVQEAAQHYTKEDWDTIRAKLEANAELTKSLQGESTSEDFAKKMVEIINKKRSFMLTKG
ncbi:putative ribonuclease H-like domain-containing protein [Tanacetum coccineum]